MTQAVLAAADSYQACIDGFRWPDWAHFNIAHATCDRHAQATPDAVALVVDEDDMRGGKYSESFR